MAKGIGRASALLASGTLISRVLGFVKAIVLANTIGVVGSASADAFANASQLPGSIYSLIATGMLSSVLVPQVVQAARHADGGQQYINRLITLAVVLLGGITIAATLAAPIISRLYGASLGEEQLALVIAFAYWCLPQIFFYGLYTVLGEVLNARGMFAPFAWAPVLNNLVAIAGMLAFMVVFGADAEGQRQIGEWTGPMIAFLAGSATLGTTSQAFILFFFWHRAGLSYRPDFQWRGTGLGKAGKLAGWTFGMLMITQIAGVVETNIANIPFGQAAGVAAHANAMLIFTLAHGVITVSIATAYFPRLSAAASEGRTDDLVRDFSGGFRLIGLFLVFSAFGLAVISPAFARIFESTQAGVDSLAIVLICFLAGLVPFSGLYLVQRAFYALEETKTLFWLFLATVPVHIFGMAIASILPLPFIVAGLALSLTVASTLRLAVLMWLLRRRLGHLDTRRILSSYALYALAGIVAAIAGATVMWLLGTYSPDGFARGSRELAILACAVGGTVMLAVYLVTLFLLRSRDLLEALAPVLRRFGRGPQEDAEAADLPEEHEIPAAEEEELEEAGELAGVSHQAPAEIDWTSGPPTEAMPIPQPEPQPASVLRDPSAPISVPWGDEEVWGDEERHRRDETAYIGAWAIGGATEDLSTAGIILPLITQNDREPRSRRERREQERRAVARLQARREREERQQRAAKEQAAQQHGPGGPEPDGGRNVHHPPQSAAGVPRPRPPRPPGSPRGRAPEQAQQLPPGRVRQRPQDPGAPSRGPSAGTRAPQVPGSGQERQHPRGTRPPHRDGQQTWNRRPQPPRGSGQGRADVSGHPPARPPYVRDRGDASEPRQAEPERMKHPGQPPQARPGRAGQAGRSAPQRENRPARPGQAQRPAPAGQERVKPSPPQQGTTPRSNRPPSQRPPRPGQQRHHPVREQDKQTPARGQASPQPGQQRHHPAREQDKQIPPRGQSHPRRPSTPPSREKRPPAEGELRSWFDEDERE